MSVVVDGRLWRAELKPLRPGVSVEEAASRLGAHPDGVRTMAITIDDRDYLLIGDLPPRGQGETVTIRGKKGLVRFSEEERAMPLLRLTSPSSEVIHALTEPDPPEGPRGTIPAVAEFVHRAFGF